jgi:hypothetical protein
LVRLDRKKPATRDTKQHFYSQILSVCRARGYRPGWAANQYRAFFGVWPRDLREVEAAPSAEVLNWLKSQSIRYAKSKEARHAA